MILVDTSAWIEFFRGHGPIADEIDELIDANQVALCGPVLTELRRGLRSAQERKATLPLLRACHLLSQPDDLWEESGELGFFLARRGVHCRSFDLLIAVYALAHDVALLTRDADFAQMRKAGVPLQLTGR